MASIQLKDGHCIPRLGFGTYMVGKECILHALRSGYRLIDTATLYG